MKISGNEWRAALLSVGMLACGNDGSEPGTGAAPSSEQGDDEDGDAALQARTETAPDGGADSASSEGGQGGPDTCATVSTGVELLPVHLAFAFDVSGSMGKGDRAWHDPKLKWEPVVAATKAFFAAPSSAGITASLTFFPGDNKSKLCDASEYAAPDVAMTALPSPAFGAEIDRITPESAEDWRSGTPTVAVMRGSQSFVTNYRAEHEGRYAIVLVTDGYPQSCGSTLDRVDLVVDEAEEALASDVRTYVVGVANPKVSGAPDTVSDLHRIAAAGGTEQALLIDTGDPAQTARDFSAAIDRIRQASISCSVRIPDADSGPGFDKQSVAVRVKGSAGTTPLAYDKSCTGPSGWHYDDIADPTEIVLCESTCNGVRADAEAKLEVEFACEPILLL